MTSNILYRVVPFSHTDDGFLHKYSRRCYRPRYNRPGDVYTVAPMSSIPKGELPPIIPVHTRIVSPLSTSYRAPNLPEKEWSHAEHLHQNVWTQPGILIQIFSIINPINIRTVYLLERTTHLFRKWKRIILSFHLSEISLYIPHVVDEIDIE